MKKKPFIALLTAGVMLSAVLAGCAEDTTVSKTGEDSYEVAESSAAETG